MKMKRRDFLKDVLSVPAIAVIARTDTSVLKVPTSSPKPSEVEVSEGCPVEDEIEEISGTYSGTYSASPSASNSFAEYYSSNLRELLEQREREMK